jgi:LmbE family N-acetylglucosaminyl deacetylase
MFNENDKILIIAAHPDDEVLGCGGTICKFKSNHTNDNVNCLILSEGLTSRGKFTKVEINEVKQDAFDAAKTIGIDNSYFEDLPNNRLDSMDLLDIIQIIEGYIARIQPTVIFTHHHGDINIAHRITYDAVLTACRPLENCPVKKVYSFEIPSSSEWNFPYHKTSFAPNVFVEIGDFINKKIEAMHCYKSERRVYPHPRSPEALFAIAQRWGSVSNLKNAEAFELVYERVTI